MDANPKPQTAYDVILTWSADRPAWQRDALRRIVQASSLNQDDLAELAVLCKQGRMGVVPDGGIEPVHLDATHFPANPGNTRSVTLTAIKDVDDVNRLAPGQTLAFAAEGITVVYGDNGTGKSGYGRLLKRVCRARHSEMIQPDVYGEPANTTPRATLCYQVGGIDQSPDAWQDTGKLEPQPHPILSAVSVFDADCAVVHLKGKTNVAFKPSGLDVPDALSAACKGLKTIFEAEKTQLEATRNAVFTTPPWSATTAVGKAGAKLTHATEIVAIERLAEVGEQERARLARLTEDLSKDPATAAADQRLRADRVKHLLSSLAKVAAGTSDEALDALLALGTEATARRAAAEIAAGDLFGASALPDVGGETWRALWESARRYSTENACPHVPFPPSEPGILCVLCHQPLSDEASRRMQCFEAFVQGDTERLAAASEKDVTDAAANLSELVIRTSAFSGVLAEIALEDVGLAKSVRRAFASARLRRRVAALRLAGMTDSMVPAVVPFPLSALADLERRMRAYAFELDGLSKASTRTALAAERLELADRVTLADYLVAIRGEVARLQSIKLLDDCLSETSTNAITMLGNLIADQVLTPHLRDRFSAEIIGLVGGYVRVEMVRSAGQFGSPYYEVRLLASPSAKVAGILSEGEQTCVAIAAFLAELATATHKSAVVFEDPVTSLDHRWRLKVAKRLVEESKVRQVIVFTHDIVFANDIQDAAAKQFFRAAHITRSAAVVGMVNDNLPWAGMSILARVDDLQKRARGLLRVMNDEDEAAYREAGGLFYSRLREA